MMACKINTEIILKKLSAGKSDWTFQGTMLPKIFSLLFNHKNADYFTLHFFLIVGFILIFNHWSVPEGPPFCYSMTWSGGCILKTRTDSLTPEVSVFSLLPWICCWTISLQD